MNINDKYWALLEIVNYNDYFLTNNNILFDILNINDKYGLKLINNKNIDVEALYIEEAEELFFKLIDAAKKELKRINNIKNTLDCYLTYYNELITWYNDDKDAPGVLFEEVINRAGFLLNAAPEEVVNMKRDLWRPNVTPKQRFEVIMNIHAIIINKYFN